MINTNYNMYPQTFTGCKKISISKLEQYLTEGLSIREIAGILGVSQSTVYNLIRDFDIKTPNKKITENIDDVLTPYVDQNLSLSQLCKKTGLSQYMVKKWYQTKFSASPDEVKHNTVLGLLKSDLKNREIAEKMHMNINTVKYLRQKYNLGNIKRKKENMMKKIIEKIKEGLEKTEIAEKLGISYSTVNRYLKRLATGELKLSDD